MDWLFEHLRVVIIAIVVIVWFLRSIAGAKKAQDAEQSPAGRQVEDTAEAERTRQIQEEIRRRILARQRGEVPPVPSSPASPPPLPEAPVVVYDDALEDPEYAGEGPNVPMPAAAARRRADEAQAAILEQQRVLAEQLHALRMTRSVHAAVVPGMSALAPSATARIAAHRESCRRELIRDLRSPTSLRRAILLKEILGAPLALQKDATRIPRP